MTNNIPANRTQDLLPQVQRWHEGEAQLRKIKKLLEEDPRNTLEAIFEVAEDCKLGWQMYLLTTFGVDAEAMTVIKGFKPPRTLEAAKGLLTAGSLHTFWSHVLDAKKDALAAVMTHTSPYTTPRGTYAAARGTVIGAFEELPATFGVIARVAQNEEIKEWAATRLAAWTDTQISLDVSSRLRTALTERASEDAGLPEQGIRRRHIQSMKLLELLPASLVAFSEWQHSEAFRPGSGGKSYVSRAADCLEKSGSEQAEKDEEGKRSRLQYIETGQPEERYEDPDLEAAEARMDVEHNRKLLRKIESRARLTLRQRQVYELDKDNVPEAQIARRGHG